MADHEIETFHLQAVGFGRQTSAWNFDGVDYVEVGFDVEKSTGRRIQGRECAGVTAGCMPAGILLFGVGVGDR